jgi:hypothetical protein
MAAVNFDTLGVLNEIEEERAQQDAKWGEQNHPDGTGRGKVYLPTPTYERLLQDARSQNDSDRCTFESILREEFCEAVLESDPAKLRAELVQAAAVAVAWIEAIDRRA